MDQRLSNHGLWLASRVFRDGASIPSQYTCKGRNARPPLNIFNVPSDSKSLALIMHDPDAVGSDFTHWLVWNIPPDSDCIQMTELPAGAVEGMNSAGKAGYYAPCPPMGTGSHRYMFDLYALDITLSLKADTDRDKLEDTIKGHILDEHTLIGTFESDS